jgi:hypothetical protein
MALQTGQEASSHAAPPARRPVPNNGLAAAVLIGWTWQVPLAALGAIGIALALLAPFAREHAPQRA